MTRDVRGYDYVNHPYAAVREALVKDPAGVQRAALFPIMHAELSVYPLTATETQLDLQGRYAPPLGIVGGAVDAVVGHRIAEASVHCLVADVASYLREHLR